MKYVNGLKDRLCIRFINLILEIFPRLVLIPYRFLIKFTKLIPYNKVGQITYLFCLNVVDVASRYKASIPIGARSVSDRQGILTSKTIARALEKIYNNPEYPLIWLKLLITNKGSEFKGECEKY